MRNNTAETAMSNVETAFQLVKDAHHRVRLDTSQGKISDLSYQTAKLFVAICDLKREVAVNTWMEGNTPCNET